MVSLSEDSLNKVIKSSSNSTSQIQESNKTTLSTTLSNEKCIICLSLNSYRLMLCSHFFCLICLKEILSKRIRKNNIINKKTDVNITKVDSSIVLKCLIFNCSYQFSLADFKDLLTKEQFNIINSSLKGKSIEESLLSKAFLRSELQFIVKRSATMNTASQNEIIKDNLSIKNQNQNQISNNSKSIFLLNSIKSNKLIHREVNTVHDYYSLKFISKNRAKNYIEKCLNIDCDICYSDHTQNETSTKVLSCLTCFKHTTILITKYNLFRCLYCLSVFCIYCNKEMYSYHTHFISKDLNHSAGNCILKITKRTNSIKENNDKYNHFLKNPLVMVPGKVILLIMLILSFATFKSKFIVIRLVQGILYLLLISLFLFYFIIIALVI